MMRATPRGEPGLGRRHVADAAAELHRQARHRRDDGAHGRRIGRLAGEGAVEIHDMYPAEAGAGEFRGLRAGILVVDGRLRHVAALQPHHLPRLQVDGGVQRQSHAKIPQRAPIRLPVFRPRPGSSSLW
jgi:hypothetical protein